MIALNLDKSKCKQCRTANYVEPCSFVSIETNVASNLTYNFWNTSATDIKYVLVEGFESAEYFSKVLKY